MVWDVAEGDRAQQSLCQGTVFIGGWNRFIAGLSHRDLDAEAFGQRIERVLLPNPNIGTSARHLIECVLKLLPNVRTEREIYLNGDLQLLSSSWFPVIPREVEWLALFDYAIEEQVQRPEDVRFATAVRADERNDVSDVLKGYVR
jgi:hypothetical protein